MPSCTAAVVQDQDWVTGFAHAKMQPTQVLDDAGLPANHRRWPLDLAPGPWLYYVEIETHGPGPLDFSIVGTGVAKREGTTFKAKALLWGGTQPTYGASVLVHDGYTYLYASGPKTYLARTTGAPDDAKAYTYWDGKGWSASAHPLPDAGPEASVRWNAYLEKFVWVDVPSMSHDLRIRFADRPEGPWSEGQKLLTCQPPDAQIYGGKQHVELDQDGGRRIVITYNTNAAEPKLADRPDIYWPRAVRVTFTR
jgi:hypothetical protein